MALRFLVSLVLVATICNAESGVYYPKQLAGPPSEFALHTLPEPQHAALASSSAMMFVKLAPHNSLRESYFWQGELFADSPSLFAFSLYFPVEVKLVVTDPEGQSVDVSSLEVKETLDVLGDVVPVSTYMFENPKIGVWNLQIEVSASDVSALRKSRSNADQSDAVITVFNKSPMRLVSNLNTYELVVGAEVGLEVRVQDAQDLSKRTVNDVIFEANLALTFPDGKRTTVSMADDGMHADKVASDGEFSAAVRTSEPGNYLAQAVISGIDMSGNRFLRTTQHAFAVTSGGVHLTRTASATTVSSENRMIVSLGVHKSTDSTLRAYGELWGQNSGKDVAICWVGGLVSTTAGLRGHTVELEVDLDWIAMAQAQGPFTLRNVVLQVVESWAVVASAETISVTTDDVIERTVQLHVARSKPAHITEKMREGIRPNAFLLNSTLASAAEAPSGLILLHGYCSASNPWTESSNDFTNALYFLNAKASISNDAFAKRVIDWSSKYGAFSALGHSQGGPVITHIKNYYWSGLDLVTGSGRQLQSVGSPYKGCSAAGSLANIGQIFGVGCGQNVDLTVDGSALWMVGITATTRAKMFYYTSTYKLGSIFGDYCQLAMNLILEWPNDGTSEYERTVLPGAVNMGNRQEWCHVSGFKYPAQTLDHVQNRAINAAAAR